MRRDAGRLALLVAASVAWYFAIALEDPALALASGGALAGAAAGLAAPGLRSAAGAADVRRLAVRGVAVGAIVGLAFAWQQDGALGGIVHPRAVATLLAALAALLAAPGPR
jgi:hypothetical protein